MVNKNPNSIRLSILRVPTRIESKIINIDTCTENIATSSVAATILKNNNYNYSLQS